MAHDITENSHPAYRVEVTTLEKDTDIMCALVQLNYMLLRETDVSACIDLTNRLCDVFEEHSEFSEYYVYLFLLFVYTRDLSNGKGERKISYQMFNELFQYSDKTRNICKKVLLIMMDQNISSYADILRCVKYFNYKHGTSTNLMVAYMLECMIGKLKEERENLEKDEKIKSLITKWSPKEGSKYDWKYFIVRYIAQTVFPEEDKPLKSYRKFISKGNEQLKLVERLMCDKRWKEIDPGHVPSLALKKYQQAFLNLTKEGIQRSESEDRIACATRFREHLHSGKAVHGDKLMVHDIIHQVRTQSNETDILYAQLTDIITKFKENITNSQFLNMITLVDTSGSMSAPLCKESNTTCMDVSIGLGLLISQIANAPFKDKMICFDATPEIYNLSSANTLKDKLDIIKNMRWGDNTDFESALNLVLNLVSLVPNPESVTLLVLSDMQFDEARGIGAYGYYGNVGNSANENWDVAYERICKAYALKGIPEPKIIFWNLRHTGNMPSRTDAKNCAMLSGFNQAALKAFLMGKIFDQEDFNPWNILKDSLERYDEIRNVIRDGLVQ